MAEVWRIDFRPGPTRPAEREYLEKAAAIAVERAGRQYPGLVFGELEIREEMTEDGPILVAYVTSSPKDADPR